MTNDPTPPPAADNDNKEDAAHARWRFIGDVLVLQLKLVLGNLHNLLLIPATLGAAALDLIFKADKHGARFYRVLGWGRQADEAIGLYNALDRDEESAGHDFNVDTVVSHLEAAIVREYANGGTAASVKVALDKALDKLHMKTDKGAAKAREAAQRVAEKIRAAGDKDPSPKDPPPTS
jgi:hypothetical protein